MTNTTMMPDGVEIEREARRVTAYDIRFVSLKGTNLAFEVDCSSGFYVRSLSEDIGSALGCGAHVSTLRRTIIAELNVGDALTLAEFEALSSDEARIEKLQAADQLLTCFPKLALDQEQSTALKFGQKVELSVEKPLADAETIRLYEADDVFLGLGHVNKDGQLVSKRLFIQP